MLQPLATRRSGARAASVSRAGGRGRRRRRVERRRGRCSPQHKAAAALTPQSRALAAGPGKRQPPEPLTRIPARTRRQGSPGATAETSHSPIAGRWSGRHPSTGEGDGVALPRARFAQRCKRPSAGLSRARCGRRASVLAYRQLAIAMREKRHTSSSPPPATACRALEQCRRPSLATTTECSVHVATP